MFSSHFEIKLEINRKKFGKITNMQKLITRVLSNEQIKELKREIRKYLKTGENRDTTCQDSRGAATAGFGEKCAAVSDYIQKKDPRLIIYTSTLKRW